MLEILQDVLIILLAGYMTWDNGSGVQVIGFFYSEIKY